MQRGLIGRRYPPLPVLLSGGSRGTPVPPPVVTRLIGDRVLHASMVVSRPNKGASYSSTGVISMAENDSPRWTRYGRLLVEGYKVNSVPNPRGEKGTSPTETPQGWIIPSTTGSVVQVVGRGVEDGIPYVDVSYNYATGAAPQNLLFAPNNGIPATRGSMYFASFFVRWLSLTTNGFSTLRRRVREAGATGGFVADQWFDIPASSITATRLGDVEARTGWGAVMGSDLTQAISMGFRLDASGPAEGVLRVGAPNFTQYGVLNSPIWPDAGVIAQTARNTDMVSCVIADGQGSFGGAFQVAFPGQWDGWGVLQLDDGTDDNRIVLAVGPDDSNLRVTVVRAGVEAFVGVLGTINLDMRTPFALTWGPDGIRARLAGQPTVVWEGVIPVGLVNVRPGQGSATWNRPLYGGIGPLDHYDRPVATADILEAVG